MDRRRVPLRTKFVALRTGRKSGSADILADQDYAARRKSETPYSSTEESNAPTRDHLAPRVRSMSVNYGTTPIPDPSNTTVPEESPNTAEAKLLFAKKRIRRHVEVEAYTYGFDVTYADYLVRYNKVWAVVEILDTLEIFRLFKGIIKHLERIVACVNAFLELLKLTTGPNQTKELEMTTRRLKTMICVVKSVIIQTTSIQEVLEDMMTILCDENHASVFRTQINKVVDVRAKLNDVCQRFYVVIASLLPRDSGVTSSEWTMLSNPRKYNNPTRDFSQSTVPKDKKPDSSEGECDDELSTSSDSSK